MPSIGRQERDADIARRYQSGQAPTSIGRRYGISRERVCQILAREGVPMRTLIADPVERFMSNISPEPNSGCWLWTGSEVKGYGVFLYGGTKTLAHRYSFALYVGEPPKGKWVLHSCDTRPCVNPDHLFLGDHQDNMNDMAKKGRGTRGALPFGVRPVAGCNGERYSAAVCSRGRRYYLGVFGTIEEAASVAATKKRELLAAVKEGGGR